MFYWRMNYFESLKAIAAAARSESPLWQDYVDFCLEYERGLRANAFAHLEKFISVMERAAFAERRRFVSWLLTNAHELEGKHMLIPYPLQTRIVEPTLLEWTETESTCSEPHRWLGDYESLEKALALDPTDQIARKRLVIELLSRVGFATHELPAGFIGSVEIALGTLERVESLLPDLTDPTLRTNYSEAVEEERAVIDQYLRKHP